ncbi:hypothetical protein ABZP36_011574 [Zizania latifolia]
MKQQEMQALCKRHGLSAGGSNAVLAARLTAIPSPEQGGASRAKGVVGVVVGKGCLKRSSGGSSGVAKKVTFVLEEEAEEEVEMGTMGTRGTRGTRRRTQRPRVKWSQVAANTRGRQRKAGEMLTATAAASGGGMQPQRRGGHVDFDVAAAAEEGGAGEPGADAPRRRRRSIRNVPNWGDADGADISSNSTNAGEEGLEVGGAVVKKRKRMTREIAEKATVSEHGVVSGRITRSNCLLKAATVLQCPVVEKKRGRRRGDAKEQPCHEVEKQLAQVNDVGRTLRLGSTLSSPVVEGKINRRKAEEPVVEEVVKVAVSGRITRSSSVAAPVVSPIVLGNKRNKKEEVQVDAVPVVPANVAPSTRHLRNRVVEVNDNAVRKTRISKKPENKRQSCRPSTQRHQQLASSLEEEAEQIVPAPCVVPQLRRSGRRHSKSN